MKQYKFLKVGPNKDKIKYSLSLTHNREVDSYVRKQLAKRQSHPDINKKRERVESAVQKLGGETRWLQDVDLSKKVLPMTKEEYEKFISRAKEVGKKLDRIKEIQTGEKLSKYSSYEENLGDAILAGGGIMFQGNDFDFAKSRTRLEKDEELFKKYGKKTESVEYLTPLEANAVLKGIDRQATALLERYERLIKKKQK